MFTCVAGTGTVISIHSFEFIPIHVLHFLSPQDSSLTFFVTIGMMQRLSGNGESSLLQLFSPIDKDLKINQHTLWL